MTGAGVYLRGLARWLRGAVTSQQDASEGLVLLVGGLAAVGVVAIAAVWGLPA